MVLRLVLGFYPFSVWIAFGYKSIYIRHRDGLQYELGGMVILDVIGVST